MGAWSTGMAEVEGFDKLKADTKRIDEYYNDFKALRNTVNYHFDHLSLEDRKLIIALAAAICDGCHETVDNCYCSWDD